MKILHTSDWHLGKYLHEHSLLQDQKFVLEQIVNILGQGQHDVLLIAGDLYDRSVAPEEAVTLFNTFLRDLKSVNKDCKILLIAGNHDSSMRLSYCADILPLGGIHIGWDPHKVDVPVRVDAGGQVVDFYLMPFLYPSAYSSHAEGEVVMGNTHQGAVEQAIKRIRGVMNSKHHNVLVGHLFTSGGEEGGSERGLVGTATQVDASIISGFDYVALGHLHRPQRVSGDIYYSGSPVAYSFREANHKKRIYDITISGSGVFVEPQELKPLVPISCVKGLFSDFLDEGKFADYLGHYLEVSLLDDDAQPNAMAVLKKRFPNLLNLHQEPKNIVSTTAMIDVEEGVSENSHFISFWEYINGGKPAQEVQGLFDELADEVRK